jgi:dihydrodipicolinate reductase
MKNKNLLITGAATRVGKAIALHFAEKGWNIALHYFRSSSKAKKLKKIIEQKWVKVALIKADLKNPKQTEKIIPFSNKAALFTRQSMVPSFLLAKGIIFSTCFGFFRSAFIKATFTQIFSMIFFNFLAFDDDRK